MLSNRDNTDHAMAYWIVVNNSELWLVDSSVPVGSAASLGLQADKAVCIGQYQGLPVMWINEADIDANLPLESLRDNLLLPEPLFLLASKAIQYSHMSQSQRFCSVCGGRNFLNHNEIAMQCGECRTIHYPRIYPCIIVAVRREDKILLAQHPKHKGEMYTVIAGFLEVGETLEECVAREVLEETGIKVKNIRYFGSQPWPFPSSMMVGYLADYDSGTIQPDYTELADVKWFSPQELPLVAPEGTIARALIEQTIQEIHSR